MLAARSIWVMYIHAPLTKCLHRALSIFYLMMHTERALAITYVRAKPLILEAPTHGLGPIDKHAGGTLRMDKYHDGYSLPFCFNDPLRFRCLSFFFPWLGVQSNLLARSMLSLPETNVGWFSTSSQFRNCLYVRARVPAVPSSGQVDPLNMISQPSNHLAHEPTCLTI